MELGVHAIEEAPKFYCVTRIPVSLLRKLYRGRSDSRPEIEIYWWGLWVWRQAWSEAFVRFFRARLRVTPRLNRWWLICGRYTQGQGFSWFYVYKNFVERDAPKDLYLCWAKGLPWTLDIQICATRWKLVSDLQDWAYTVLSSLLRFWRSTQYSGYALLRMWHGI